jgi:hypothetical protein
MKAELKFQYKCPWCGLELENGKELEAHAKNHYVTLIEA